MKTYISPEDYIIKCRSLLQRKELDLQEYGAALRSLIDRVGPFRRASLWRPLKFNLVCGK